MFEPRESALPGPHILYDAAHFTKVGVKQIDQTWFDPDHWEAGGYATGFAGGRGRAVFFRVAGVDYVLRHYQRGGWAAPLLGDRYLWAGLARSRAWREWRLLSQLVEMELPVPRPVAAQVACSGIFYRADIITLRINNARALSQRLHEQPLPTERWKQVGRTLKRFHTCGVDHPDLNAHNILVSPEEVFLIDFDRGRLARPSMAVARRNLRRLQRSLTKISRHSPRVCYDASDWQALMQGYADGG